MNKAQKAYLFISNESFGIEDISKLGDHALTDQSIFSKKIMIDHVSSRSLPYRLTDASDPNCLPYPFVFSPSRKNCFARLLPSPKSILALIYRMKVQNHVVFYIGNINQFNWDPFKYVKEEMFFWFYEEIEKNVIAQTMLSYFMNDDIPNIDILLMVFYFLNKLAKENGKDQILIIDQYNKLELYSNKNESSEKMIKILNSIARKKIYVTTNTDKQITGFTSHDTDKADLLILDETDDKITENEMKKIIKKLFDWEENEGFAESLFEESKGSLSLIFLFYNHWANKRILTTNKKLELYAEYKDFSKKYSQENLSKHKIWISQNGINIIPQEFEKLKELMMFLDLDIPYSELCEYDLIDARYIFFTKEGYLKSINPLITKTLREFYWTPNMIEKFLNHYHALLSGYIFGGLYERYIIEKIKDMNRRGIMIDITINGNNFSLNFEMISTIRYGGMDDKGIKHGNHMIKFSNENNKENKSVLYLTPHENFPLFDFLIKMKDVAVMWNLKKNVKFETNMERFQDYVAQTKKNLSKLRIF